jgi:hypothetical protein
MAKAKTLADKLLLKPGQTVRVVNAPDDVATIDGAETVTKGGDVVLVYAVTTNDVQRHAPKSGERLWIAYPKAGKLGTNLSRDVLHEAAGALGWDGVRLVSLDDTWSAMMFRPRE